jgi:hypothetical protein
LPLQLEIELLLALHCTKKSQKKSSKNSFEIARQDVRALTSLQMKTIPVIRRVSGYVDDAGGKKYRPIGVTTGDAKAQCAGEVKPEPLPEFSGDRCDGHCDVESELYALWSGLGSGLVGLSERAAQTTPKNA